LSQSFSKKSIVGRRFMVVPTKGGYKRKGYLGKSLAPKRQLPGPNGQKKAPAIADWSF